MPIHVIMMLLAATMTANPTATNQFDLVCPGNQVSGLRSAGALGLQGQKAEKVTLYFRVDISAKRWCGGDCLKTADINEVTDRTIMLVRDKDEQIGFVSELGMNREDGSFIKRTIVGDFVAVTTGTCERATFSGFPARRF
jgi:hypothetical protein